jgi:hypothetical protein
MVGILLAGILAGSNPPAAAAGKVFDLAVAQVLEKSYLKYADQFDELQAKVNKLTEQYNKAVAAKDNATALQILVQKGGVIDQQKIVAKAFAQLERQIRALPWKSVKGKTREQLVKEQGDLTKQILNLTEPADTAHAIRGTTKAQLIRYRKERLKAIKAHLGDQ